METTIYYIDHYTGAEMKLVFGDRISEICRNVVTHLINGAIAFVKEEGQISINRNYSGDQDASIREICQTAFVMDDIVAIVNTDGGVDTINRVEAMNMVVEGEYSETEDGDEETETNQEETTSEIPTEE